MNHVLEIVREEADGLWHAVCRACGYGTLGASEEEATRNAEDAECVPAHDEDHPSEVEPTAEGSEKPADPPAEDRWPEAEVSQPEV